MFFSFLIQVKATFADETLDFAITSVVGSNSISKDVYDYDYEGSGDDGGVGAPLDIHAGIEVDSENRELAFDVEMSPGVRVFLSNFFILHIAQFVRLTLFDIHPSTYYHQTEAKLRQSNQLFYYQKRKGLTPTPIHHNLLL